MSKKSSTGRIAGLIRTGTQRVFTSALNFTVAGKWALETVFILFVAACLLGVI